LCLLGIKELLKKGINYYICETIHTVKIKISIMKNLFILMIIVFSTFNIGVCQEIPDTIPNAGFEHWKSTGWFENPVGWQTNNTQIMEFVVKDSNSHTGKLAMRIKANGWAQVQLPIINDPKKCVGFIIFSVISNIPSSDQFSVEVYFLKNSGIIDTGHYFITNSIITFNDFATSEGENSCNPDSIRIIIKGGTVPGNYIIIDDLILHEVWLDNINEQLINKNWKIFSLNHNLQFEQINTSSEFVISIYTVTGQNVSTQSTRSKSISVPLDPGIYFYKITHDNSLIQSGKVVVN
jgi:hypothetical protein